MFIAAFVAILAVQTGARGAEYGHPIPSTEPTESQIAECQQWAAYYWAWKDTGQIPPGADEFSFSFTTGGAFDPFQPTVVLFTQLYASQLSSTYTIWNLIEDDPEVLAAFRHHSLTGEVTTSFNSPATIEHLNMIAQAISGGTTTVECEILLEYTFPDGDGEIRVEGDNLVSNVVTKKKRPPCPPGPGPTEPDPVRERLRQKTNESKLPWSDCYRDDSGWPWGTPGFDCDDYAQALRNYLRNKLIGEYPDMQAYYLWLTWWRDGHCLNVIVVNGKYYVIDAQTGAISGPYSTWEEMVAAAWQMMRDLGYLEDDPWFPSATKSDTPRRWREP